MSLPVVRRTTYDAALAKAAEIEAELRREVEALRETLMRSRDDHEAALADRDRVTASLARARAEADRFAAALEAERAELTQAADAFAAYRREAQEALEAERASAAIKLATVRQENDGSRAEAAAQLESERSALSSALTRLKDESSAREAAEMALADARGQLAQISRRLDDFRAETERLGAQVVQLQAVHRADVEALARTAGERDRFASRLKDFEREVTRLGNQVLGVIDENRSLTSELAQSYHAEREAYGHLAACTRDPLLIGTFPRSGTWMLRYFLCLLDQFSNSGDHPPIREIFVRARANELHFDYGRTECKSQRIALSHWMCPGSIELAEKRQPDLIELLRRSGSLEFQQKKDADHAGFHPSSGARIIFVYRNPFDVYRSYADLFEQRSGLVERKSYPFNPMVPWGTHLMNAEVDQPFDFFISKFADSGFSEFFAAYCLSFLLVRDAYPDHILALRYEDAMRDRRSYLETLVTFGKVGDLSQPAFATAFDRAFDATTIEKMRGYEAELGHAISGERTFYGEANATHLSVKKRNWRDLFSADDIEHLRETLREYDARLLDLVPELAA